MVNPERLRREAVPLVAALAAACTFVFLVLPYLRILSLDYRVMARAHAVLIHGGGVFLEILPERQDSHEPVAPVGGGLAGGRPGGRRGRHGLAGDQQGPGHRAGQEEDVITACFHGCPYLPTIPFPPRDRQGKRPAASGKGANSTT